MARSLNTSCYRTAQTRAHEAWLFTEGMFADMAKMTLSQEQAAVILDRLRTEPAWQSSTADEVVQQIGAGDWGALDLLFRHAGEIVPSLPEEERGRVLHAVARFQEASKLAAVQADVRATRFEGELQDLRSATADLAQVQALERSAAGLGQAATEAAALARTAQVASRTSPPRCPASPTPNRSSRR